MRHCRWWASAPSAARLVLVAKTCFLLLVVVCLVIFQFNSYFINFSPENYIELLELLWWSVNLSCTIKASNKIIENSIAGILLYNRRPFVELLVIYLIAEYESYLSLFCRILKFLLHLTLVFTVLNKFRNDSQTECCGLLGGLVGGRSMWVSCQLLTFSRGLFAHLLLRSFGGS